MNDLLFRIQRKLTEFLLKRRAVGVGPGGEGRISLVLYFDYEREFGNPAGKETAETGFRAILNILNQHGLRATWNCVGLIAEYYPETLADLSASHQEIASHTYHHVDLRSGDKQAIIEELVLCRERFRSQFGVDIVGLHPPRDRFSLKLPGLMKQNGYRYLIARSDNLHHWHTHQLSAPGGESILCIPSIADDWGFIEAGLTDRAMLRFWQERISVLRPGQTAAIGFHPWVLGANPDRLCSFAALIEQLVSDPKIQLLPAREIVDWYER
jgi:peptidoglycan/xylan/chitin deacetylase (PgdA/CDA1 family)